MVTVLPIFVTIEKNGHKWRFWDLCPLNWTCFPCLGSARTDTNGSLGFCVRKFSRFSWLRRLKLRTQRAVISFVSVNELVFPCKDAWKDGHKRQFVGFVSVPVLFDTLDNQAKHIKMAKLKFGMLFSVPEVTLERVKSIPILQNSVLVCPEANKST